MTISKLQANWTDISGDRWSASLVVDGRAGSVRFESPPAFKGIHPEVARMKAGLPEAKCNTCGGRNNPSIYRWPGRMPFTGFRGPAWLGVPKILRYRYSPESGGFIYIDGPGCGCLVRLKTAWVALGDAMRILLQRPWLEVTDG